MLICCNGTLRSGSALQYNLVCSLLEKVGSCVRHGRQETEKQLLSQPVQAWAQDRNAYHVIKSAGYQVEFQLARDGLMQMCYIHRDIRDIAVAAKFKWGLTGDSLLEMLDRAIASYENMEKAGAFGMSWLLHQRYENVYTNTKEAVWEIAQFLEVRPSQEIVEAVVRECSLESMETISKSKALGANQLLRNNLGKMAKLVKKVLPPPLNGSWGLRKLYMNLFPKTEKHTCISYGHIESSRGVPGAWQQELSLEEQEVIINRYKDYLMRCSYPV